MILSDAQIAQYALQAGFRGGGLVTAIAVALAESGANPAAVNTAGNSPPSRDRGLWQINSHWHPEVSDAEAFDPAGCAQAAYRISRDGTDWSPWATFTSGAYQQFEHRASMAVNQTGPEPAFVLRRYLMQEAPMLHGPDVAALQHLVGCPADSWFGPVTKQHLISFQNAHALTADGVCGPRTAAALGWGWAG